MFNTRTKEYMNMNNFYITYDVSLKRYLRKKGFDDILYGLNPKSLKPFWVYERTDKLNLVLKDWLANKS